MMEYKQTVLHRLMRVYYKGGRSSTAWWTAYQYAGKLANQGWDAWYELYARKAWNARTRADLKRMLTEEELFAFAVYKGMYAYAMGSKEDLIASMKGVHT